MKLSTSDTIDLGAENIMFVHRFTGTSIVYNRKPKKLGYSTLDYVCLCSCID